MERPSAHKCVPGGIRTPNLLIRSQKLYPVELQAHDVFDLRRNGDQLNRGRRILPALEWLKGQRHTSPTGMFSTND